MSAYLTDDDKIVFFYVGILSLVHFVRIFFKQHFARIFFFKQRFARIFFQTTLCANIFFSLCYNVGLYWKSLLVQILSWILRTAQEVAMNKILDIRFSYYKNKDKDTTCRIMQRLVEAGASWSHEELKQVLNACAKMSYFNAMVCLKRRRGDINVKYNEENGILHMCWSICKCTVIIIKSISAIKEDGTLRPFPTQNCAKNLIINQQK